MYKYAYTCTGIRHQYYESIATSATAQKDMRMRIEVGQGRRQEVGGGMVYNSVPVLLCEARAGIQDPLWPLLLSTSLYENSLFIIFVQYFEF